MARRKKGAPLAERAHEHDRLSARARQAELAARICMSVLVLQEYAERAAKDAAAHRDLWMAEVRKLESMP